MAARNSRPTSGATRAKKNSQGAGKPKAPVKGQKPPRNTKTSGAKRSNYQNNKKFQGTPKKVKKVSTPKMSGPDSKTNKNARAAWSKFSKAGPKY